jgi:hypothetical protein
MLNSSPAVMPPGSWKYRRRVVFVALIFIAAMLVYLVERRPEAAISMSLVNLLVPAAVGIIWAYVFGAVIDDKNARSAQP